MDWISRFSISYFDSNFVDRTRLRVGECCGLEYFPGLLVSLEIGGIPFGAFGVDTTLYTYADGRNITKAEKKVLEMIDRLVMRFDKARGN